MEEEGASMTVEEEAEDVDTLRMLAARRHWKGLSAVPWLWTSRSVKKISVVLGNNVIVICYLEQGNPDTCIFMWFYFFSASLPIQRCLGYDIHHPNTSNSDQKQTWAGELPCTKWFIVGLSLQNILWQNGKYSQVMRYPLIIISSYY